MKFLLLTAAILAMVNQSLGAASCSPSPGVIYTIHPDTNCKRYTRNMNRETTVMECPAGLKMNVLHTVCKCEAGNFYCPIWLDPWPYKSSGMWIYLSIQINVSNDNLSHLTLNRYGFIFNWPAYRWRISAQCEILTASLIMFQRYPKGQKCQHREVEGNVTGDSNALIEKST